MDNSQIAARLEEVADILSNRQANFFRIQAYRNGAKLLRELIVPVHTIIDLEGIHGLQNLKGIGPVLSRSIFQLATTGKLAMLERLRSDVDPVELLATVPGVGKSSALRLYEDLGISTLEQLEIAAHDGRLARLMGYGFKRIAGIRDSLANRLGQSRIQPVRTEQPSVEEILEVDQEYRTKAQSNRLPLIAPRRFNPERKAWLPIYHVTKGERRYTALFSNTARAHKLGKTQDWVVLYHNSGRNSGQSTVVTAYAGPMKGKRIVRGREAECQRLYESPIHQLIHA